MASPQSRPVSPHLQVYKQPLTALVSISHRITGVINSLALVLLVWVLASAAGTDGYGFAGSLIQSWFGKLVMFGFTFTLYFHFCNGIRHLFWDIGKGFELEDAMKSAKICIGAAVALSVVTWIIAGAS
ncbi:MAG: succinate dehydrogenase, cytochrome b556 subunit [Gammaproteobacteria bacterium]|nr:succinate dehydrogenase, cytochrome b556 subunit [Gammaproteobacteria bacterium]